MTTRLDSGKGCLVRRILDDFARCLRGPAANTANGPRMERHLPRRALRDEELRFPGDDIPRIIESGAQIDERRRTLRIPAMLVGPHPLDADRPAVDGVREQRRVARRVLVTVAPIAAGTLEIEATHGLERH